MIVRIPANYFVADARQVNEFSKRHPTVIALVWCCRNVLGTVLVASGLLMLVLPGQGLLTIAVGLIALDFPGKHGLERRVIQIPAVHKSINWLRQRRGATPLKLPFE